jgi:hypothetical protein
MSNVPTRNSIRNSDANVTQLSLIFSQYNGALPLYEDSADLMPRNLCVKAVRLA